MLQLRVVAQGRPPLKWAIFAMPEEANQRNGTSRSGDWLPSSCCPSRGRARYAVCGVSRNKTPPTLIYFAEGKLNLSTKQDATMFTKLTIAMSVAVILSAAAVSPSTQAFAEGSHLSYADYATSSQKGKAARAQMNLDYRGNANRGERLRQQDAQPSWIDNPASPGG